jgi:hypothetical protein
MTVDTSEEPSPPLLTGLFSSQRPLWVTFCVSILLIVAPLGVSCLDGILPDFFSQGYWRPSLLPSAVIIYIVVVSPVLARGEANAIEAFRPIVLMDDDGFNRLVNETSRLNPVGELVTFGAGAAFGLWVGQGWLSGANVFWLRLWLCLSGGLMFGMLGWAIYAAVGGTQLTTQLHRQPLRIDIFNTRPFEPIGRQSLIIALVFVGGIALSMVFGVTLGSVFDWENWVLNILLLLVPIGAFFLTMRDTHSVLVAAKKRELETVQQNIHQACRTLMKRIATHESSGTLAAEINALVAYEERIQAARTWPYNTGMLRTLFFSFVIPGGAAAAQVVFEIVVK